VDRFTEKTLDGDSNTVGHVCTYSTEF